MSKLNASPTLDATPYGNEEVPLWEVPSLQTIFAAPVTAVQKKRVTFGEITIIPITPRDQPCLSSSSSCSTLDTPPLSQNVVHPEHQGPSDTTQISWSPIQEPSEGEKKESRSKSEVEKETADGKEEAISSVREEVEVAVISPNESTSSITKLHQQRPPNSLSSTFSFSPQPTSLSQVIQSQVAQYCCFCRREEPKDMLQQLAGCVVHPPCALWSPEVMYDSSRCELLGVKEAILRGNSIKCAFCRHFGATIGCIEPQCQRSYHLPCLRESKGQILLKDFAVRCPKHRKDQYPKQHGIPAENNNGLSTLSSSTRKRKRKEEERPSPPPTDPTCQ